MNRKKTLAVGVACWAALALGAGARAQKPPLLPEKDVAALANELSGETDKRNLEGIARFHRQRGSQGFHSAAELVAERLRAYGLSDVTILQFPADGKIFYGTQRSRPAWDAEVGELREVVGEPHLANCGTRKTETGGVACDAAWFDEKTLATYAAIPVALAEDSESADLVADLIDVGDGTKGSNYALNDVKGKIALMSGPPGAAQELAGKFGVVGLISYAQNQKTAWSGENQNLIRWGHLETFSPNKTFAFMISINTARLLTERLARNEKITLHAIVKAGQHPGNYKVVTATIPGSDAKLKDEEIAFSCHLDHQRPGANDNASGCATILEVARTLQKLIDEKRMAQPARTIRFIFPPEIEGTMALLNGKPEFAKRIKTVIHMDMVGGGPETKAVFHVTRGPMSLPSFVHDVAWSFAEWVNEESYEFAATGEAAYPMIAPEGGKEPLRAEYSAYTMGSDHDVYQDSSFGIPAIYLNDWPDRYIHTNFDSAANIDPTKLKRAAFIGAASGYFLATMPARFPLEEVNQGQLYRSTELQRRLRQIPEAEAAVLKRAFLDGESEIIESLPNGGGKAIGWSEFKFQTILPLRIINSGVPDKVVPTGTGKLVYKRIANAKGPLAVFGYDYLADHAKAVGIATPKLLSYAGLWGGGEEYAYEVLNFANGKRNAQEIRDAVSAEYGPVPLELIVEYLRALEKIGIVESR